MFGQAFGESGFEFFAGIAVEHHRQDFIGLAEPGLDGIANLGHDRRTLAGTSGGNQQVAVFHDHGRFALLVGQWLALDRVEEIDVGQQFAFDEVRIALDQSLTRTNQDVLQFPVGRRQIRRDCRGIEVGMVE